MEFTLKYVSFWIPAFAGMTVAIRSSVIPAKAGIQAFSEEVGATAPCLGIASAMHETQYTRLFRS